MELANRFQSAPGPKPAARPWAIALPALAFVALTLSACRRGEHDHSDHDHGDHGHGDHDHAHDESNAGEKLATSDHGGHVHVAPRGGRLVVLAEEFANLEVLYSSVEGRLDIYALDAHAEQPVRLSAKQLDLRVTPTAGAAFDLALLPVASSLTGETVGDSSHFQATDERLKAPVGGQAVLAEITSRGQTFRDVIFAYP
jgi:hypothetical protein